MSWLILSLIALLVAAIAARLLAKRATSQTGLPSGKVIYSDTGFAVGKLGPLTTDEYGQKLEKPLISKRYGVVGRPDYLIETVDGIIPVEIKSAKLPASGRPYDSHVMQLATYCLLVEDLLDADVPYGMIRYRDAEIRVEYTPELRADLFDVIEEMRAARLSRDVHRSHDERGRCANCWMRDGCDESLM
ncbi:MAG: CRISPR-associated exonuclease Cas4 [Blastocatellia bacterium]